MELFHFDFDLPSERIAQEPAVRRDEARLMVVARADPGPVHARFRDLPDQLRPGDLLVLNDTRVMPVRLPARRGSGGRLDMLLVRETSPGVWRTLVQGARRVRSGETVFAGRNDHPVILRRTGNSDAPWEAEFPPEVSVAAFLEEQGRAPLPPYIDRDPVCDPRDGVDRTRYQTVFGRVPGAIAAPTAGLHFTPELFQALAERGVTWATVTLHVGVGTFLPVKTERIEDHRMHEEEYEVSEAAARAVNEARVRGGRVIPVGTTSLRALEAAATECGRVQPARGSTDLFIRPGYAFRVADGLVTNFHLPRSTLFMLVAAMAGLDRIRAAYAEAIQEGYRFYSFGDGMLIV
jgi:S-adenosylmethionine:tRNA ribosyltransferase-isomerase